MRAIVVSPLLRSPAPPEALPLRTDTSSRVRCPPIATWNNRNAGAPAARTMSACSWDAAIVRTLVMEGRRFGPSASLLTSIIVYVPPSSWIVFLGRPFELAWSIESIKHATSPAAQWNVLAPAACGSSDVIESPPPSSPGGLCRTVS